MGNVVKRILALSFLLTFALAYLAGTRPAGGRAQTPARDALSKWRPARDYSGIPYVGAGACAECHAKESRTQPSTPMGHASERADVCEVLKSRAPLTFRNGPYSYRIARDGDQAIYTVGDGTSTISEPVLFCFGEGVAGQTYVFRHGGTFYESRVSYFQSIQNLDITIEHPRGVPSSLGDALGRPMSAEAAQGCFNCHTTTPAGGSRPQLEGAAPGVSCEACHGPGARHVAAARAKDLRDPQIFNPASLDALELSQEFCGACHQSFDSVMSLENQGGAANIRFQPYRIFNSPGHLVNDKRMSCTACHDPHDRLQHDEAFYDSKCMACHLSNSKEPKTALRSAPACPLSTKQCASCHMPKVELPGMHFKFTDHWIRIVKTGEPVPR
ncbi:MAG TPA: multiheme c-type cytochrome [Pyrinomonadaceae bacterium]|nr:multiheme c-type cytochrome [Pyrinomonadaceae bacterium]